MKVNYKTISTVQILIQIKTATVYLASKGNLLVFYKTENETLKETVYQPHEILLPNMNLP